MDILSRSFIPTGNRDDVDFNSKAATTTLPLKFAGNKNIIRANASRARTNTTSPSTPNLPGTGVYEQDIVLFTTPSPIYFCMEFKRWNFEAFCDPALREEGVVRVEYLALDKIVENMAAAREAAARFRFGAGGPGLPAGQRAWVLMFPYVATTPAFSFAYSVFATIVPGDDKVRWFYTPFMVGPLLERLAHAKPDPPVDPNMPPAFRGSLILHHRSFSVDGPKAKHHQRLLTFAREMFTAATTFPHSQDWKNAMAIGDYSPPIQDPDGARARLEKCEYLHFARGKEEDEGLVEDGTGVEVSDDRYLEKLHEVERGVASMVGLKCAEYMFIKRVFFKEFYEEIQRSDKTFANADAGRRNGGHTVPADTAEATDRAIGQAGAQAEEDHPTPETAATPTPARSTRAVTPAVTRSTRPRADTPMTSTPTPAPATNRAFGRGAGQANRRKFVRTEHAHRVWLERHQGMRHTKAKILVVAWRELGLLDEEWFVEWVKRGGMLADGELGGRARE